MFKPCKCTYRKWIAIRVFSKHGFTYRFHRNSRDSVKLRKIELTYWKAWFKTILETVIYPTNLAADLSSWESCHSIVSSARSPRTSRLISVSKAHPSWLSRKPMRPTSLDSSRIPTFVPCTPSVYVTIMPKDIQLARRIRGAREWNYDSRYFKKWMWFIETSSKKCHFG